MGQMNCCSRSETIPDVADRPLSDNEEEETQEQQAPIKVKTNDVSNTTTAVEQAISPRQGDGEENILLDP